MPLARLEVRQKNGWLFPVTAFYGFRLFFRFELRDGLDLRSGDIHRLGIIEKIGTGEEVGEEGELGFRAEGLLDRGFDEHLSGIFQF